jgi:hypothetical protein
MEALPTEKEQTYILDNINEDLGNDISDNQELQISYYDTVYNLPLGAVRYSVTWRNLIKDLGLDSYVPDPQDSTKIVSKLPALNPIIELTPEQAQPFFEDTIKLMRLYYQNPPTPDRHRYGGEDHEVLNTKLSQVDIEWANYDKVYDQTDLNRIANVIQFADHLDTKEILMTCCQIASDKLQNLSEAQLIEAFKLTKEQLPTDDERRQLEEKYAFLKTE